MNIQQYMTPEIVGPSCLVGILFIAFLNFLLLKKLSSDHEEHFEEDEEAKEIHNEIFDKPHPNQIWYHRVFPDCPWAQGEDDSVKVLAVRGDWVQFSIKDKEKILKIKEFCSHFMKDEFGDFVKPVEFKKIEAVEEEIEDMPVESPEPILVNTNIINIDGNEYTLSPVIKK